MQGGLAFGFNGQDNGECFNIKNIRGFSWSEIIEREGKPSINRSEAADGSLTFPVKVIGREGTVSYLFSRQHGFAIYHFDFTDHGEKAKKKKVISAPGTSNQS